MDELITYPQVVELRTNLVSDNQSTKPLVDKEGEQILNLDPYVVDSTQTPLSQNTGLPSEESFKSYNSLDGFFNVGEDNEEDSTNEDLDIYSDEEEFIAILEGSDVDKELRHEIETVRELKKNKGAKEIDRNATEGLKLGEPIS